MRANEFSLRTDAASYKLDNMDAGEDMVLAPMNHSVFCHAGCVCITRWKMAFQLLPGITGITIVDEIQLY